MSNIRGSVEHVFPEIETWPIYKLSEDRDAFVAEIDEYVQNRLKEKTKGDLHTIITKTAYLELIRIKEEPWKVDPPNEKQFWKKIQKSVLKNSQLEPEEQAQKNGELLHQIIHRYSEEIVGNFRKPTFLFARRFLTSMFNRLLNTAAARNLGRIWSNKHKLENRLIVRGEVEKSRKLIQKGTLVILPTHFSNLDSILIGYALDQFAGLPSSFYGAGLNLFNTGYTAYFMNRLGAYRLDRRKKNPIYLETLKGMNTLSVQRGVNGLFFPGGTRSRSGAMEKQFKLGLIGTIVEAQRAIYEKGEDRKIYVAPLILGYHFVLEARFLIEQHLRKTGAEKYLTSRDDTYSLRKNLKFLWEFFSESNQINLSFGKPMDVLGNFVDEDGISYDQNGREVNLKEYFMTDGVVTPNKQRENEYTRHLGKRVVERFFADNVVLTSHLVAHLAFKMIEASAPDLDVFGILRLPSDEYTFEVQQLYDQVKVARDYLIEEKEAGRVKLSEELFLDIEELVNDGIAKMGTYHSKKPLKFTKQNELISENFPVLYFYHNRLDGYGIELTINEKHLAKA